MGKARCRWVDKRYIPTDSDDLVGCEMCGWRPGDGRSIPCAFIEDEP